MDLRRRMMAARGEVRQGGVGRKGQFRSCDWWREVVVRLHGRVLRGGVDGHISR